MAETIGEKVARLNERVDEIRTNHLPHIQTRLDSIDARVWWILGTLILGIILTIAERVL